MDSAPNTPAQPPRTAVITCAVLEDEFRFFAASHPHVVHIEILEQGLHNDPDKLRTTLQDAVNRVENADGIEAIVLGYGLCSRGSEGVATRRARLVIARAHDCITLLLGSKQRYADYVRAHPGTYWYSTGWNRCHVAPGKERYEKYYQQYLEKYGQENAEFLMEQEQAWFSSYSRAAFVDLGVGPTEADQQYTRNCAQWLGWQYDYQRGDPALIHAMLRGDWNTEDFLILEPGQTLKMTADEQIIVAVGISKKA